MATSFNIPQALAQPFANGATPSDIPNAPTGSNDVSLTEGLPPVTSEPLDTSGLPVKRTSMNDLGFLATSANYFDQIGGVYTFRQDVSTAIGGYPLGAKLWAVINSKNVIVVSLKNNNNDNFVLTPSFIGNGTSWQVVRGGGYLHVRDEKPSGTNGGNLSLGFNDWELNTVKKNTITGASLDALTGVITLPAGTYKVKANRVIYQLASSAAHAGQAEIYNITTSTTEAYGLCTSDYAGYGCPSPTVTGEITLAATSEIKVRVYAPQAVTGGKGYASNSGNPEVYAEIEIEEA